MLGTIKVNSKRNNFMCDFDFESSIIDAQMSPF